MNAAQHSKYIRCWIRVVRANHWVMRKGRLADDAVRGDESEWHQLVWHAAEARARGEQRAVVVDDLRKGCHVVAFGRAKSSKDLTNAEFNRLLVLWGNERELRAGGMVGLLIEPLDLASLKAWLNSEQHVRENLVRLLNKNADAACAISRNAYATEFYEDLPLENLKWLVGQLAGRNTSPRPSPQSGEGEPEAVEQPF